MQKKKKKKKKKEYIHLFHERHAHAYIKRKITVTLILHILFYTISKIDILMYIFQKSEKKMSKFKT